MIFSLLLESTSIVNPEDITILESESKNKDGSERIIFKTKLEHKDSLKCKKEKIAEAIFSFLLCSESKSLHASFFDACFFAGKCT
jgi:hypothetical protein